MPRDGSNIYHIPPGTPGVPNATIASTPYNGFLGDIEQDLNLARPIVAGGTGATSAPAALAALGGEAAAQVVTNYDSQPWLAGSFYSAAGATSAPVAGHAFSGLCYLTDSNNLFIEARDQDDSVQPGNLWVRQKKAGVWSAWTVQATQAGIDAKVAKAGDTMTGNLNIAPASAPPTLVLIGATGQDNNIYGYRGANPRWLLRPGSASPESGGNAGSDFILYSFTDAGALLDTPLLIPRNTGLIQVKGDPTVATGVATKQYVDTRVRFDASQGLNDTQQTQARQNIYAAPFDALAYNGLQFNGNHIVSQQYGANFGVNTGYFLDGWIISRAGTNVCVASQYPTFFFPGYSTSLNVIVTTAQASMAATDFVVVGHYVEGYRAQRLNWGTAYAQPITIGFWSAHHRTGTYSGSIRNGAGNRSYAFTYVQNTADFPEWKTVTIPGDTAGSWDWAAGIGMQIFFVMACGTTYTAPAANTWYAANYLAAPGQINGVAATSDIFRLAGVMVLPGSEAPSSARAAYIQRPFDQELALCLRYYEKSFPYTTLPAVNVGNTNGAYSFAQLLAGANSQVIGTVSFAVKKRVAPTTITLYNPNAANNQIRNGSQTIDWSGSAGFSQGDGAFAMVGTGAAGSVAGASSYVHWVADARL